MCLGACHAARGGGFGILDEVNMAKNEALAVLHATLDYRRVIDVPGYQKIDVSEATRFIGTMNNGYAGTRDLNEALVSRFAVIEMPVIAASDLKKLIETAHPDIQSEICEQLVTLFYELQKKAAQAEISERAVDLRKYLLGLIKIESIPFMNFIPTEIPEVVILEPRLFRDDRGYFFESFSRQEIETGIRPINFVQDNESASQYGVLRGLHFQKPPHAQSKLEIGRAHV